MKIFMLRVLWTVSIAYVLFLLFFVLVKVPISKYLVEKELTTYLNQVIERDPKVASAFYLSHTELETIKQNVTQDGFKLLSFKDVEGDYDDGCVCTGHVDLIFDNAGESLAVEAVFTTGSPRQVCAIRPGKEPVPVLSKWNEFACGGDF
ncbi:hypothetical protein [Paenibacillus arenilitoris]|uniref:Uncharacterized protein n=1 Tax=Paenibacillus arenilitoris TaxID=2772299 RepID=A0A927CN56_9BACL|nr:hypothetical protein [Paenibacillus arenilitoris]MBD2868901.1 hypothetical protein [Paenibacillus arenilitoris]